MESTTSSQLPRGIRNNNPLNIRRTATAWQGLKPRDTVTTYDKEFCQFISMEWGIRAAAVTLRTYINRYKLNTLTSIISRWAPPSENHTTAYIKRVSSLTGISSAEPIRFAEKSKIITIMRAMASVETGQWLPLHLFDKGYEMANRNTDQLATHDADNQLQIPQTTTD